MGRAATTKSKTREGDGECDVEALQVPRERGRTWTGGGEDDSRDDEVEGARTKDDDADVGVKQGEGIRERKAGRQCCRYEGRSR